MSYNMEPISGHCRTVIWSINKAGGVHKHFIALKQLYFFQRYTIYVSWFSNTIHNLQVVSCGSCWKPIIIHNVAAENYLSGGRIQGQYREV